MAEPKDGRNPGPDINFIRFKKRNGSKHEGGKPVKHHRRSPRNKRDR